MILDTDFVISLRNGNGGAVDVAAELERSGQPTRVPTAVIQELYVGVGAGLDAPENAADYDSLLANEPVVPLDANIARKAGRLEGDHLTSDDKPELGPVDAIVAATGLNFSEPILTNDEDFEHVDGLAVQGW